MRLGTFWIKMRQNRGWVMRLATTAGTLTFLLLFVFQNCADPLDLANQDSLSFTNQLPFAYDTELDTIAYMSCSEMGTDYNSRAFFTFRAGAYGANTGLRFSDSYLSATKNFTPGQRADALAQSEINASSILQLSVRQRSDAQSMLASSGGGSVQENKDYSNLLAALDSPAIAERLASLSENNRINYFSGVSGLSGRLIEGSLRYMDSEVAAGSVRDHLRDVGLLTLTYTDVMQTGGIAAKSPDNNDRKKAYGKGYQIDFRMGFGIDKNNATNRPVFTRGIHRVINSIQEVDLQRRSPTEANLRPWDCSNSYTFIIVRPQDVDSVKTACLRVADPLNPTAQDRPALEAIRRVLRPEDWWVDLSRRCVMPKQSNGFCYGRDTNGSLDIKYDGGDCIGDGISCSHYISVCVRQ